MLLNSFLILPY